jgi:hypothetical protein
LSTLCVLMLYSDGQPEERISSLSVEEATRTFLVESVWVLSSAVVFGAAGLQARRFLPVIC